MITANELRIGNWVMFDNRYFQIECNSVHFPYLRTAEFGAGVVEWNNMNPIPLTEEILLKCGFDCFEDGWYKKQITPIEFTWNTYDYTLRVMGYSFSHIKSLHELQNLFYMLCKKELEINLQ